MTDARDIIKSVQMTEKSTRLGGAENKYFFEVAGNANKIDIKRAIQELFKVSVVKVNTMNYLGKNKRERTRNFGRTAHWKRAVVTLKQGDKIELM